MISGRRRAAPPLRLDLSCVSGDVDDCDRDDISLSTTPTLTGPLEATLVRTFTPTTRPPTPTTTLTSTRPPTPTTTTRPLTPITTTRPPTPTTTTRPPTPTTTTRQPRLTVTVTTERPPTPTVTVTTGQTPPFTVTFTPSAAQPSGFLNASLSTTSTSSPPTDLADTSKSGISGPGTAVIGVAGGLAGISMLVTGALLFLRRRKNNQIQREKSRQLE